MNDNSGTLRKCVLAGTSFDVFADVNVTFNRAKFETEGQATTGKTVFKMTKRVQTKEGLTLKCNPSEMEYLNELSDSLADITMSVEYADGSVYKATGRINFENWESETLKATVTLIPSGEWTPFLA